MINVFASDRIKPSNVRFPKGHEKTVWHHASTYPEYCKLLEANQVSSVVLDSSASEAFNGLKCAKALTEIICDKHTKLPELIVVGTNEEMKTQIQTHLGNSKRWIELNRGK